MNDHLDRHDLTDGGMAATAADDARQGRRWSDHRMVVTGILFRTVYNRDRRWSLDGTWEEILERLRAGLL